MKEIFVFMFILLLGRYSAQSFGYELLSEDKSLLSKIYTKIDAIEKNNPEKITRIDNKLPAIIGQLTNDRVVKILEMIHADIQETISLRVVETPSIISTPSQFSASENLTRIIAKEFE